MNRSTAIMICNSTGRVDPVWAANWGLVDLDWNGDKINWSKMVPMNAEEDMWENMRDVKNVNPTTITWVYRNSCKALPWHTSVRTLLEDKSHWGLFVPFAGCMPSPGVYTCGPNATQNLYHDFEQTPHGDCGNGVECGEYVFDARNASVRDFFLGDYFFGPTGAGSSVVDGFYVDDGWSSTGCSEMESDSVQKMGLTPAEVQDMIAAWSANVQAYRNALVAAGKFEWFLFVSCVCLFSCAFFRAQRITQQARARACTRKRRLRAARALCDTPRLRPRKPFSRQPPDALALSPPRYVIAVWRAADCPWAKSDLRQVLVRIISPRKLRRRVAEPERHAILRLYVSIEARHGR